METPPGTIYQFGPFEANAASGELLKQGRRIRLQELPFRLLVILLENSGEVVTRAEIQSRIWNGNTFVDFDSSLKVAVGKLRDALGDDAHNPQYIETIPKRGYRFHCPAFRPAGSVHREVMPAASTAAASSPAGTIASPASRPASGDAFSLAEANPRSSRPSSAAFPIAALALFAAAALAGTWSYRSHSTDGEVIDSVAVLPFVNGSGDPNMDYLSDGITETLINDLAQLPNIRVMSRASAFRYKGMQTDARTVGDALGVRAVFEGRVVEEGDRLAISAELIDARDNSHIWGEQYNRKSADIFAIQEDIAKEITTALRTHLSGADEKHLSKSYTADPEAYRLYLQGRFWWNKRSEKGYDKGIQYFEQAIQKDPNYALAYAGLADCYAALGSTGVRPPMEVIPKAKEAAQKALEIDNTLVEARPALALVEAAYDWDWADAEKDIQQAIALNPSYVESHQWYGQILRRMGRFDEAVAEHRRALELDPLSLIINENLGQDFYAKRQYDQAIEQLRKTIELDPNFGSAHSYLGMAYLHNSMYKEAIAEFDHSLAISPDNPVPLSYLGYAYGIAGRKAEARKVLEQLNRISKQRYVSPGFIAVVYLGLGEKDQAIASLQKAFEDRSILAMGIKGGPNWDTLRSDPRFTDLLGRVNLQP